VTAQNSGGQSTFTLTIQVVSGVLLDLGHANGISTVSISGARALSEDSGRHWVLWDTSTDQAITSGDFGCTEPSPCAVPVAIAGPTVAVPTSYLQGFRILAASDGHTMAIVAYSYGWLLLASDGSYVVAGGSAGLEVWSPTGMSLYKAAGNYSGARVYAAPGQIQIALGPAGQNVIETVSLASGTSSNGATFQGQFVEWFSDGSHFQTYLGGTLWTYSNQSVLQGPPNNPSPANPATGGLMGAGNWFWTEAAGGVEIFAVGSSAAPTATFPGSTLFVSGLTLGIQNGATLTIVDLSGVSLSSSVSALVLPTNGLFTEILAASDSEWFATSNSAAGVLVHSSVPSNTPKTITLGQAWGVAGGGGLAVVGTQSGTVFIIDPQTKLVQASIPNIVGGKMQISADGTELAILGQPPGNSSAAALTVYSLPSLKVINAWSSPAPYDFWLDPPGDQIAIGWPGGPNQIEAVSSGAVLGPVPNWTEGMTTTVLFSPDGTYFAVSAYQEPFPIVFTYVYHNFQLTTTISGGAFGWIDNGRLLIASYTGAMVYTYEKSTIYSPTGVAMTTPVLPELGVFQSVTSDSVYSAGLNSIYSISSGALLFGNGHGTSQGAVAGAYVVFVSSARVLAVPY
jgi:hypothetical protein